MRTKPRNFMHASHHHHTILSARSILIHFIFPIFTRTWGYILSFSGDYKEEEECEKVTMADMRYLPTATWVRHDTTHKIHEQIRNLQHTHTNPIIITNNSVCYCCPCPPRSSMSCWVSSSPTPWLLSDLSTVTCTTPSSPSVLTIYTHTHRVREWTLHYSLPLY